MLLSPGAAAGELAGATAGPTVDVGGGLAVNHLPWTPGGLWSVGVGGWWGKGDAGGAIGRNVAIVARWRSEVVGDRWHNTPGLEVRRGIDLIVLGIRFGGFVGPRFVSAWPPASGVGDVALEGLSVLAHGGLAWRFRPPAALLLRLDAGVDVDTRPAARHPVTPALGLMVGFEVTPVLVRKR